MARLYLISDVLHNCSVKGPTNVSFYRLGFQTKFPEIFADLRDYHKSIDSRMKAESFKQRVMSCFKAWEDWALYPQMELIKYQNIFLGLVVDDSNNGGDADGKEDDDVDGNSMSDDDDVDGIPLDGAALLKASKGAFLLNFRTISNVIIHIISVAANRSVILFGAQVRASLPLRQNGATTTPTPTWTGRP